MAGLGVGQKITYFELPDQQDYPWSISGQLEMGPVMLSSTGATGHPTATGNWPATPGVRRVRERGAQIAGISVDPPSNNARMVGKLLLPFPSSATLRESWPVCSACGTKGGRGRAFRRRHRSVGEVRYLYSGTDVADRPRDEEVLAALDGLDSGIERLTGGPEFQVGAAQASESSVRPGRRAMEFEQLISYYRGVYFTTEILEERFGGWGRSGKQALEELDSFQQMVRSYIEALEETIKLH